MTLQERKAKIEQDVASIFAKTQLDLTYELRLAAGTTPDKLDTIEDFTIRLSGVGKIVFTQTGFDFKPKKKVENPGQVQPLLRALNKKAVNFYDALRPPQKPLGFFMRLLMVNW
jgi:hypothetical protein